MSRIPRQRLGRGVYHVINRILEQRRVLESDETKALLLDKLVKFTVKRPFHIYHWCLMDNHFHMAVEVVDVRDMTYVVAHACRCFSMAYHRQHGGSGYLWQSRFKSILVQKAGYLERLGRYIERNPIAIAIGNPRITEPADYRWSSARAYVYGESDPLVCVERHPSWAGMGNTDPERRECYRRHLQTARERDDDEDERLFEIGGETVVGDDEFRRQARTTRGRRTARSRGGPRKGITK